MFRTFPNLKWAQSRDFVFLTIDVLDVEKTEIDLTEAGHLKFQAHVANKLTYGFLDKRVPIAL